MRLIVRQNNSTISEFNFTEGPIYIGRHKDSQIFLGHRAVSRQHAVIFHTEDGKWMVEDLDSANKTYLNDKAIHKTEVKNGDVLRVIHFTIEVVLKDETGVSKPIDMEDTLTKTAYDLQASLATPLHDIVVRDPDAGHAPAMRLPAHRLIDFSHAAQTITKVGSLDELLLTLLNITLEQFDAYNSWVALRSQPAGPMTSHAGKQRNGRKIKFGELSLNDKINQAVEKGQYLVLPRVSAQIEEQQKIRSAIIAPIMQQRGCVGVLYLDNAMDSKHYNLGDLDYLMLVAAHTAAIMENL